MKVKTFAGLVHITHTKSLVHGSIYTIDGNKINPMAYFLDLNGNFKPLSSAERGYGYEILVKDIIGSDIIKVYDGCIVNDVIIKGTFKDLKLTQLSVKYKEFNEVIDVNIGTYCTTSDFTTVAEKTIEYYNDMLNKNPEITILDVPTTDTDYDTTEYDEVVEMINNAGMSKEETAKVHKDIISQYNRIMEETSAVSRTINQNTKLEDIQGIQEAFIRTRDKLQEYSKSTLRSKNKFVAGLQSLPWVGKVVDSARDTINNTKSVQDNIDALFISMHKQYEKLVEIGTGLQEAKAKQELQLVRLEALIKASDAILSKYGEQVNIPIKELSDNNQIKTSYERIKRRILKTEAAIMGTQASIVTLGKTLPSDKAEMTEELSLNGLLDSLSDYQGMYTAISGFLNDVVTATSEKTYSVVENLMDMQINDTKALEYLEKDTVQSRKFATMLTEKANKLADKSRRDAIFIESVAKGNSILEARRTIQSLGYSPELPTKDTL